MSVVRYPSALKTTTFSIKDSAKTLSICMLIAQHHKVRNNFHKTNNTHRSIECQRSGIFGRFGKDTTNEDSFLRINFVDKPSEILVGMIPFKNN